MNRTSKAYAAGYGDGLGWDLDGFRDRAHLEREEHGWDSATINAMPRQEFLEMIGVDEWDSPQWADACEQYNAGCHAGALASQAERTGHALMQEECE